MTPPAKRKQDYWREWAAKPLQHMELLGPGCGRWVLMENGEVTLQWTESELPGLAEYLAVKLAEHHGAWHSAHGVALPHVARSRRGGIKGAESRWGHKRREVLEGQIAAALARGENPHDHIAEWSLAYNYSKKQVRRLIDGT